MHELSLIKFDLFISMAHLNDMHTAIKSTKDNKSWWISRADQSFIFKDIEADIYGCGLNLKLHRLCTGQRGLCCLVTFRKCSSVDKRL